MKALILAVVMGGGISTMAGAQTIETQTVNACFAGAGPGDITASCIGYAARVCSEADNHATVSVIECNRAELSAWDAILNRQYGVVRDQLGARDPALSEALLGAQRAWLAYRDAECGLRAARVAGSYRNIILASCLLDETAERALELRDKRIE